MTLTDDFLLVRGLAGGVLLGISSALLYRFNGRIAGISGIFGGLVLPRGDASWRATFVVGLLVAGLVTGMVLPHMVGRRSATAHSRSSWPAFSWERALASVADAPVGTASADCPASRSARWRRP